MPRTASKTNRIRPLAPSRSFAEDTEQTLRRLRGAVVETLGSLGLHNERPQDIARQLGLDKSLAWKIARIAQASDPYGMYQHIPGPTGIDIFLQTAERRGAPADVLEEVRKAVVNLDQLVHVHAGDRGTFELMLSAYSRDGQREAIIDHRKLLFKGASSVWGVQAFAEFLSYLVQPVEPGSDRCDIACVKGFIDLRRLRPDVPWRLCRSRCSRDDGTNAAKMNARVPLDEKYIGRSAPPLLEQFCSRPLPELRRTELGDGFVHDELVEGPIGNTGAVTCITGELLRNVISTKQHDKSERGYWTCSIETPVEWLIFDLIVHESLIPIMPPSVTMYSKLGCGPEVPEPGARRIKLPTFEEMEDLGQPAMGQITQVPLHREMISYALENLGWNARKFRGYRATIAYPVIASSVVLEHKLFE